jgi:hypothetical protein
MIVKVRLIKPVEQCGEFLRIVAMRSLLVKPLTSRMTPLAKRMKIVENTTEQSRIELEKCTDVFDLVIDNEDSKPV